MVTIFMRDLNARLTEVTVTSVEIKGLQSNVVLAISNLTTLPFRMLLHRMQKTVLHTKLMSK